MSRDGARRGISPSRVRASERTLKFDFSLASRRSRSLSCPVVGLKFAVHIPVNSSTNSTLGEARDFRLVFKGWERVVSFLMQSMGRREGW